MIIRLCGPVPAGAMECIHDQPGELIRRLSRQELWQQLPTSCHQAGSRPAAELSAISRLRRSSQYHGGSRTAANAWNPPCPAMDLRQGCVELLQYPQHILRSLQRTLERGQVPLELVVAMPDASSQLLKPR